MATITSIERLGNNLAAVMSDGTRVVAYKSNTARWIVGSMVPPVEPDPEPVPGGLFAYPFPLNTVTEEWMTYDGHRGMDFAQSGGTPIPAAAEGEVIHILTGYGNGWGNYVRLDHGMIDGVNIWTAYAHMVAPPEVQMGQIVAKGQRLGGVGNTGNSQGNHLHFEVWQNGERFNPRPWMDAHI